MATTTEKQRDVFTAPPEAAALPTWATTCLNCGTSLAGHYCHHCGQRAAPPHATLRELGGEALNEFSGWDGKFVSTLKLLFVKPGELTRQFLDGRRAHFISPLRLYLTASVLFFLAVATTKPHRVGPKAPSSTPTAQELQLAQQIDLAPPAMRPLIRKVSSDKQQFINDVTDELPKVFFAMLPVFALILMAFYKRRSFADHLYFSIHIHAFIFAALDIVVGIGLLHPPHAVSLAALVLLSLWVPLYTHLAIVRVYGGSQLITLAKELGISALYAAASFPVITLLAMYVAWSTS